MATWMWTKVCGDVAGPSRASGATRPSLDATSRGQPGRGVPERRRPLSDANLKGANLSRANLSGANLENANLKDANLTNANLTGRRLRNIECSKTWNESKSLLGQDLTASPRRTTLHA